MSDATTTPDAAPWKERLVRWLPALIGLGAAGVGLAAAGVAASQVTITVTHPEPVTQEADPLALLRDDVAALQTQLERLREGTGKGFQALGRHIDATADERQDELLGAHTALAKRVVGLERSLAAARRELKARPIATVVTATAAKPGATPAAEPAPEPLAQKPPAEPEPLIPRRKKKRRSLFGFKLAAGGPDFAHRTRYTVIGSLSRVGFDAKSTLHDFSGATTSVGGRVVLRLDEHADASGEVTAKVASLKTGVDGRDEEMRKVMNAEKHPWITFRLERLVATRSDPRARTFQGEAHGSFTIHGVQRAVVVPVSASVDASQRLMVKGEAKLKMSEFKVEVPSVAGAIKVEDEVKVWLSLRLRALGRAGEASK